jgi:hypothetical protein
VKTAFVFFTIAVSIIAGVYYYYLSIGGVPLETLFTNALGLQREEEGNGLPIVVNIAPYILVIVALLFVGILLHRRSRKMSTEVKGV